MSNQKYFDVPWAFAGNQTSIPDALQSSGSVSFTEGWNFNYQRNLSTDPLALPIDRSTMNYLLNTITTAIQALQAETIPEFILASQNGGVPYPYLAQAEVFWSASGAAPFTKFTNLNAGNTNTPSLADPLGATTGWQVNCDPIATSAQATAGTNNASIMTPLLVAQQTNLRALLAGNSAQVFNVGPATAPTHAMQLQQATGRLLRRTIYGSISGVLSSSVNGSAFAPASATFTALAATNQVIVQTQAAGGGGAGAQATAAGQSSFGAGGGGGGWAIKYLTSGFSPQTITVGIGGAGGSGNNPGAAGGNSTFGVLCGATGGQGGTPSAAGTPTGTPNGGAAPGVGTVGDLTASGQGGFYGWNFAAPLGGNGGSSQFGGGAITVSNTANGLTASSSGAGGSGACNAASQTVKVGGNGAPGLVIVDEYQ